MDYLKIIYKGKSHLQIRMMTGGTPTSGNPHITKWWVPVMSVGLQEFISHKNPRYINWTKFKLVYTTHYVSIVIGYNYINIPPVVINLIWI